MAYYFAGDALGARLNEVAEYLAKTRWRSLPPYQAYPSGAKICGDKKLSIWPRCFYGFETFLNDIAKRIWVSHSIGTF